MQHPPHARYDVERVERVARSAEGLMERCSRLREQQRALVASVRANLMHIQGAHAAGSSLLEALRVGSLVRVSPEAHDGSRPAPQVDFAQFRLTARERQVAELLALGRSNAGVAEALGISEHTARHHTESVLAKLGVRSRAEAGAMVRGWFLPTAGSAA
jgi:DNA-binding NarL/FixJ family response regulator